MLRIFLSTHGNLASGLKSAAEFLVGEQPRLTVFDAYVENELRSVEEALNAFYETLEDGDTALLLADVVGGSVCNTMSPYSLKEGTYVVGGINLPLLLEFLFVEDIDDDVISALIDLGRSSVKRVKLNIDDSMSDEEDFF